MALDTALWELEDRWIVGIGNRERHVAPALMWPFFVIMSTKFFHEMLQVLLATDHEVIKAFDAQGLNESFGVELRTWARVQDSRNVARSRELSTSGSKFL